MLGLGGFSRSSALRVAFSWGLGGLTSWRWCASVVPMAVSFIALFLLLPYFLGVSGLGVRVFRVGFDIWPRDNTPYGMLFCGQRRDYGKGVGHDKPHEVVSAQWAHGVKPAGPPSFFAPL